MYHAFQNKRIDKFKAKPEYKGGIILIFADFKMSGDSDLKLSAL